MKIKILMFILIIYLLIQILKQKFYKIMKIKKEVNINRITNFFKKIILIELS